MILIDAKSEWEEVSYTPEQLQEIPGYGDSWMFMPDGYGQPRTAFLTHEVDDIVVTTRRRNRKISEDVTFDLYTMYVFYLFYYFYYLLVKFLQEKSK